MKNLFKKLMLGLGIICMSFTMVACGNDNAGGGQSPKQEQGTGESGGSQGGSTGGSESGGQEQESSQDIANNAVYNKLKSAKTKAVDAENYKDGYTLKYDKNNSIATTLNRTESVLPTWSDGLTEDEKQQREEKWFADYEATLSKASQRNSANVQAYVFGYDATSKTGFYSVKDGKVGEETIYEAEKFELNNDEDGKAYLYEFEKGDTSEDDTYRRYNIGEEYWKNAFSIFSGDLLIDKQDIFNYSTYKQLVENYKFSGVNGVSNIKETSKEINYKENAGIYTLTAKVNEKGDVLSKDFLSMVNNANVSVEVKIVFDENGIKTITIANTTTGKFIEETNGSSATENGKYVSDVTINTSETYTFSKEYDGTDKYEFDKNNCVDKGDARMYIDYYVDGIKYRSDFIDYNTNVQENMFVIKDITNALKSGYNLVWHSDPEYAKPYTFPIMMPSYRINVYAKNIEFKETTTFIDHCSVELYDIVKNGEDLTLEIFENYIANQSNFYNRTYQFDTSNIINPVPVSGFNIYATYVNGKIYHKGESFELKKGEKNIVVEILE